jgi:hypothetical protein
LLKVTLGLIVDQGYAVVQQRERVLILRLAFFENHWGLSVLLLADIDGAEPLQNIGVIKVLASEARNSDCLDILLLSFLESLGQEMAMTNVADALKVGILLG